MNFVITSLSPWDFEYGSNIRDIALELSKAHQVLFVNIPLKRTEIWGHKKKWVLDRKSVIDSRQNRITKVNSNCQVITTPVLFEPINKIKNKLLFDLLNKVNNKRYARAIERAISDAGFDNYILINDNDFYSGYYLPDLLKADQCIYYLRDYMRAMTYWQTHSNRLEPELIKKYDRVMTNSSYLAQYARQFNNKSFYVGQGCEIELFLDPPNTNRLPEDLIKLERPIIGYIGALNSERLDIQLIKEVAQLNPNYSFVLIGPEDEEFATSDLHNVSNIHFLGKKEFNSIKNYMYAFDVCINPQHNNKITQGNYPRKVDEYLAAGKPVIATYTETMVPFQKVTYLAKDPMEFSSMIKLAIEENSMEKIAERKEFASKHTWKNSVSQMLEYLTK